MTHLSAISLVLSKFMNKKYIYIYPIFVMTRRSTDEDCRCGRKFWTLYIFYWIKVFFKLPFAVSFSVLFLLGIPTACYDDNLHQLCIYIYIYVCVCVCL